MYKIIKLVFSIALTVIMCTICAIDIKVSAAVIIASIGCTLITDSATNRIKYKEMPKWYDWVEYGSALVAVFFTVLALTKNNVYLFIGTGICVVTFAVMMFIEHKDELKNKKTAK